MDSSLFTNSSDITTKEILKRYGDIGRSPARHPHITDPNHPQAADSPPPSSKSPNAPNPAKAAAPVITHVDSTSFLTQNSHIHSYHGADFDTTNSRSLSDAYMAKGVKRTTRARTCTRCTHLSKYEQQHATNPRLRFPRSYEPIPSTRWQQREPSFKSKCRPRTRS